MDPTSERVRRSVARRHATPSRDTTPHERPCGSWMACSSLTAARQPIRPRRALDVVRARETVVVWWCLWGCGFDGPPPCSKNELSHPPINRQRRFPASAFMNSARPYAIPCWRLLAHLTPAPPFRSNIKPRPSVNTPYRLRPVLTGPVRQHCCGESGRVGLLLAAPWAVCRTSSSGLVRVASSQEGEGR